MMAQTVKEMLIAAFDAIIEGLARYGYGLGGILPPEDYESE